MSNALYAQESSSNDSRLFRFFNIHWETDGESDLDLPTEAFFDVPVDEDVLEVGAELLSDQFGWLVNSFDFVEIKEEDSMLRVLVYKSDLLVEEKFFSQHQAAMEYLDPLIGEFSVELHYPDGSFEEL